MSESWKQDLREPLLPGLPDRSSFKETKKFIEGDLLAQHVVMSLDNAIKWDRSLKNTPRARKLKKIYAKIVFIKHITFVIY